MFIVGTEYKSALSGGSYPQKQENNCDEIAAFLAKTFKHN